MTRRILLPTALFLALVAGCSSSTPDEDPTTPEATPGSAEAQACEAFTAGTGTPLAERAEAARSALSGGAVVDAASYSEVNVLEQRISELAETAPESVATLLDDVRAPFTEAVHVHNEAMSQGEDPQLPDFTAIDVEGSAAAQQELDALCEAVA